MTHHRPVQTVPVRNLTGEAWDGMWRLDAGAKRKYEAAERFGLTEKLLESGWPGLSAKDAGRIGGAVKGWRSAPSLPPDRSN